MSVEQLLRRASLLLDARRHEAAGALIGVALGMDPDSVAALVLRARCLLVSGDVERALDAARAAARRFDGEATREIVAECTRAACDGRLERARDALRRHDTAAAWTLLQAIAGLGYQTRLFLLICAPYGGAPAAAGRPRDGPAMAAARGARRGRGGAESARTIRVRGPPPAGRTRSTARACSPRCWRPTRSTAASCWGPRGPGSRCAPVLADLHRAADLLKRLKDAADLQERARPLRASVGHLSRRVAAELRVHRTREFIGRHNAIVATYGGRPISSFEASNARRSLAPLAGDVAKLRRQCPPGSPEARALADLAAAIAALQRQLQHYV